MSKARGSEDPVKTFNTLVDQHNRHPSDKTLASMKTALKKLSPNIVTSSQSEPGSHQTLYLLLNCQQLLLTLEQSCPLLWDLVVLLTSLSEDQTVCTILSTRLSLLPCLSRLLHAALSSSQSSQAKSLLLLARNLVVDLKLVRREAYLATLLTDLASILTETGVMNVTAGSELTSLALYTLCHLCRGSYLATKTLVTEFPLNRLTSLTFISSTDQLYAECLCYYMRRVNLSKSVPDEVKVGQYLPVLTNLFVSSVTVDDVFTMRLILLFLRDLQQDPEYRSLLAGQENLDQVRQLLVSLDLNEEFNPSTADLLFSYLTEVTSGYQTDYVALFDPVIKLVHARLEAKPLTQLVSALRLVRNFVSNIDFNSTSLSSAEEKNLKFQMDQLLPSLNSLASGKNKNRDSLETFLSCLDMLQGVASVPGWGEQVGQTMKANKLQQVYLGMSGARRQSQAVLTTEFLSLARQLGETSTSWSNVAQEMEGNRDRINMVAETLRSDKTSGQIMKKALSILARVESPEAYFVQEEEKQEERELPVNMEQHADQGQTDRIDSLLEQVTEAVSSMQVERVIGEVVQLATARGARERLRGESLQSALSSADSRIASQTVVLAQQEKEMGEMERMIADLSCSLMTAREELQDIRAQHGDLSREADCTRDKLGRELADTKEMLKEVGQKKAEVEDKYCRQKDQNVQLSQDLKQYKENEEQLQGKLKMEMKAKEEVSATLSKKLKKKEQLLEEEMTQREKAEREGEELRKQVATMEQLSKRQEHVLSKKDKELTKTKEELGNMQKIHDQIFNLSTKARGTSGAC